MFGSAFAALAAMKATQAAAQTALEIERIQSAMQEARAQAHAAMQTHADVIDVEMRVVEDVLLLPKEAA